MADQMSQSAKLQTDVMSYTNSTSMNDVSASLSLAPSEAQSFLEEHQCFLSGKDIQGGALLNHLKSSLYCDAAKLFPPRLLDSFAYEGEVNKDGVPHGYGIQCLPSDEFLVYEGIWCNGRRHGTGQLIDERLGAVVYAGGWKNDVMHGIAFNSRFFLTLFLAGFGVEEKGSEIYEGWFQRGVR